MDTQIAVVKKQTTIDAVRQLVNDSEVVKRFEVVLKERASTFLGAILSLVGSNKQFDDCDSKSILAAAMQAATLDLEVNPNLGQAHIIPYNNKVRLPNGQTTWVKQAQFQLGYKGYIQLALRSGQYKTINATPVYENEIASHNRFTGEIVFNPQAEPGGKVVGYLAYIKLVNGFEKSLYMTVAEVTAHAQRFSKMFNKEKKEFSGVWASQFDGMALKTVLKKLISVYGIASVRLQKAIAFDQAVIPDFDAEPKYIDNPTGDDYVDVTNEPLPEVQVVKEQHDVEGDRTQIKPAKVIELAPEPQNGNGKKQKKVSTPPPVKETQESAVKDFSELTVENCDEVLRTIAGIGTQAELNAWKKRNMIKFSGTQHAYLYDAVEEAVLNRTWELEEA